MGKNEKEYTNAYWRNQEKTEGKVNCSKVSTQGEKNKIFGGFIKKGFQT